MHARGTFDVTITPQPPDDKTDGLTLGRMVLDKQFHGDLEAVGKGQMLTGMAAVQGSGAYVAIERVTGTLHGRQGSFILHHLGIMERGVPKLTVTVVPDSGTGELTGLAGELTILIKDGKHSYDFAYDESPMAIRLPELFLAVSVKRMQLSEVDIYRCIDKLSDEQMWHRGADHENSIANLLLHLEGNMRQWFLHGIAGQPDVRVRDAEFAQTSSQRTAEVRSRFSSTLAECCTVIASLAPERLLESIDPQPTGNWGPMTILEAILRITGHLQLHQGQIILLTKQLTGADLDLSIPRKR